jgi:hypothetical protein
VSETAPTIWYVVHCLALSRRIELQDAPQGASIKVTRRSLVGTRTGSGYTIGALPNDQATLVEVLTGLQAYGQVLVLVVVDQKAAIGALVIARWPRPWATT